MESRLEPEQKSKVEKTHSEDAEKQQEENTEKLVCDGGVDLFEDSRVEDELSAEELQMFEQENQRLVSEMNSLVDEVRQIEGKVVEISRLQEIFAEKVLQQETEIDNIHQLVVGATENVKEGNEDIREYLTAVQSRFLSACGSAMMHETQSLFIGTQQLGINRIPTLWKTSCLVPVPKK
ncbi:syntaxin-18-like [Trichomycterus rosablanca]|uniref:syntaxin-18-like n=1 Tax=Trichomycterus rosablanca TaxID=2290929 RepID=UPI002F35EEEF